MMDFIHICMMIDIGPNISSVCLLLWGQGLRFKHHRCVLFFFFFFLFFCFSFPSVHSQWTPQAKGGITLKNNGTAKYF